MNFFWRSCGCRTLPLLLAAAAMLSGASVRAEDLHARHALPAPLQAEGFTARQVGAGLLTWFGFEIYDASLWTPDGTFSDLSKLQQPVAFSLWYRRSFSRQRLIDITIKGWREFNLATLQQQQRWAAELAKIWVDTTDGANMTTLVLPGGATRFYNAQRYLGSIDDPAFGPAFLGIWLDEQTRGTRLEDLRMALLGQGVDQTAAACAQRQAGAQQKSCP